MLSPYFMSQDPFIQFAGAFLLIFAVVFGTVKLTNVGRDKSAAALVSVAIALFASLNQAVVSFIWQIMPYAAIIIVFLFLLILVKNNLFGGESPQGRSTRSSGETVIILFLLLVVFAVLYQLGVFYFIPPDIEENLVWGLAILVVIFILYYGIKSSGNEERHLNQ